MSTDDVAYGYLGGACSSETGEIALFGDSAGLTRFCRFVEALDENASHRYPLDAPRDVSLYDERLDAIEVQLLPIAVAANPEPLRIQRDPLAASLRVSGSRLGLETFSAVLRSLTPPLPAGVRTARHGHIEPDPDGVHIAADSASVVVYREPDNE